MKKLQLFLLILTLASLSHPSAAQVQNTMGTDFWVAFMDNIDTTQHGQTLSMFATSFNTCVATVTNPNTGWSQSFTVNPSTTNRIYIPLSQAYTTTSGQVTNTGLHVTSTDTISLYTITQGYPNLDYANILPTAMLRSDYMVQTYPADRYSSEFSIVAAEDSVNVSIILNGNTIDGHYSGQTYNVLIPHAGQVYQVESTRPGDLSGTRITASDNKKIAVFNGDVCVYIPNYTSGPSCDHVVEQAMPTVYWGQDFIVAASQSIRRDYVRVTSLGNNCTVTLNGTVVAHLNSANSYQYQMSSTTSIDHIETSGPAVVYIYFPSLNGTGDGDPSMTTITPIEQKLHGIRFPTISTTNVTSHWINLVCETSTVPFIRLDGNSVASQFHPIANAPGYSYMRGSLSVGTHNVQDIGGNGFIACMYGFGQRVSYGYTLGYAGRNLRNPEARLLVKGQDAASYPEGFNTCVGKSIRFEAMSDGDIVNTLWSFGDGEFATDNPKYHAYSAVGDYEACVEIIHRCSSHDTVMFYDTLCTVIHVYPNYWTERFDTCVQPNLPVNYHGDLLYSDVPGDTVNYSSAYGCDSVEIYHLKVWYNDTLRFDTIVCDTLLPFLWRGVRFTHDSVVTHRHTNCHGADSIVVLTFNTVHCPRPVVPPVPREDTTLLWIPNVFTPGRSDNNVFKIFSNDIVGATVKIFDRWGGLITKFDGLTQSWDGTTDSGHPCPQGAYVYKIDYRTRFASTEQHTATGTVTLLR